MKFSALFENKIHRAVQESKPQSYDQNATPQPLSQKDHYNGGKTNKQTNKEKVKTNETETKSRRKR